MMERPLGADSRESSYWLQCRGVSVAYRRRLVLQAIDWTFREGAAVLLIGPSGAGKSTLAGLVAGLIPGVIEADIQGSWSRHPRLSRPGQVGYVFQDPDSQFCQLRAGEEVAFGLENLQVDPARMEPMILRALAHVDLPIPLELEHDELSGGLKQRLAIASALAMEPPLLILDEPTANLDPRATAQVFETIRQLVDRQQSLLVIEHKFWDLLTVMPDVVILDATGHLRDAGPTEDVIGRQESWMKAAGLWREDPVRQWPGWDFENRPSLISLAQVTAERGRPPRPVLHEVSVEIRAGELIAVVGPNGAGKSTLLKVLAGLLKPRHGVRRLATQHPPAFGFQNPEHQFVFERVGDELANRIVGNALPPETEALLQTFGLADHVHESPYSLSQGQKRRLSVATMIAQPHEVYLLDEPTFGQDPKTQDLIMQTLVGLCRQGRAVVFATHDLDLVRQYASTVWVVQQGKILWQGPPDRLLDRPELMKAAHLVPDRESVNTEPMAHIPRFAGPERSTVLTRLNPAGKLASFFVAVGLTVFIHHLSTAVAFAGLGILLLTGFSGLGVTKAIKRLLPFSVFFGLYTWMMAAYAAVGPHTPTVSVLWYHLSYPGLIKGLILGFRMLAAVTFGLVLVSTVDMVDLVKSLSRWFRVPPKFSYGTLAGLRFFPRFEEEWRQLTEARRVRGRETRQGWMKVITYALPLLSQAVRLSERVAIAMEARGFQGPAAEDWRARTYYRVSPLTWRDGLFAVVLWGVLGVLLTIKL
ncbi:MAG: ATP-binding cassette domain-containing protein [Sulfobacillus sp.]|nr:ATP-binding cassette domain-containing protein [Sulfobacillus sp.]